MLLRDKIWLLVLISLAVTLVPAVSVLAKWLEANEYYGSSVNLGFPSFSAVDALGNKYDLDLLKREVNIVFFGNTRCASICAPRVNLFKRIKIELDNLNRDDVDSRRINFVFITLDPEFDTPERLHDYFQSHDVQFKALSIRDESFFMRLNARLGFVSQPLTMGQFQHSDYIYLIEPGANVRLSYSGTELEAKRIADDLVKILVSHKPNKSASTSNLAEVSYE